MKKLLSLFSVCTLLAVLMPSDALAARIFSFSGYDWTVKSGYYAPGPNNWSDAADQVYTDANGALHMGVQRHSDGQWYSSEVLLPASLGYGAYEFEFASRMDQVDTNLVAAPFLYQDDTHELDIEYTNWKSPGGANVWYTAQPVVTGVSSVNFTFAQGAGPVVARITWLSSGVTFETVQNGVTLARWVYTGTNNFVPGGERLHINFWMIGGTPPSDGQNKEIVVNRFGFTPISLLSVSSTTASTTVAPPSTPTITTTTSTTIKTCKGRWKRCR